MKTPDHVSKAKWYVLNRIHNYELWQEAAAFNGDRRGSDIYRSQILRYRRLHNVLESNLTLAEKLINAAINRNMASMHGTCWERYLLECYEGVTSPAGG